MLTQFTRKTTAIVAALAVTVAVLTPATAGAQPPTRAVTVPVVGAVVGGGTFNGTATLTRFINQNGQLTVLGVVTGILTNAAGTPTTVVSTFAAPVSIAAATCSILHLVLGPLNLNLLGLQVDLSQIVLDITGQTGPGNLLGNLLCSIAGLLDSPGGLARLLNQILGILG
jgi:hypothetical protein